MFCKITKQKKTFGLRGKYFDWSLWSHFIMFVFYAKMRFCITFCKQNVSSKNMALRAIAVSTMIIFFQKHYIIVAGRAFFNQL